MVDSSIVDLSLARLLALELFVEGEDGLLSAGVDVSCSSAAAAELAASLWETGLEHRGRALSGGASSGLGGFEGISCTTSSRVDVGVGSWVRFDDGIS